jgi:integrase
MTNWSALKKTKFPNVLETPTGGHLVRARVVDPTTDKLVTIKKTLQLDAASAYQWLQAEIDRIRSGKPLQQPQKQRFSEFAAELQDDKLTKGEIKSAKGRERWGYTLEHLIAGTTGEKSGKHVPGFGDMFIDKVHASHVEQWQLGIAGLIQAGDYAPTTANGWLSILRVVMKAAKRKYGLSHLATEDVGDFDTSNWVVYSEEEPNSLLPEQVPLFLERLRALHPQHYAMAFVGFATGLRPSSLRPLRRRGPKADVLWDQNRILVRQSQTRGEEVMNVTKQGTRYKIDIPETVTDVLKWHVESQLRTPEQQDSDLLFPSITGGFRSPTVLNKPFAEIAEELGLPRFTQVGMRRTYNDLARAAGVIDLVTRSISGHSTEQMQHHYSTVSSEEQRSSIAKVIRLFVDGGPLAGPLGSAGGPQKEKTG